MAGKDSKNSKRSKKDLEAELEAEAEAEEVASQVADEATEEQKPVKKTKAAATKAAKGKAASTKKGGDKAEKAKKTEEGDDDKKSDELRFEGQLKTLKEQLKDLKTSFQGVSDLVKKLENAYKHDTKKLQKRKPKRTGDHKPTGFAKQQPVPTKLAKFIGVEPGTELSGPEITKKVWTQLRERNLTYKEDKRVFRTDKVVSDVFGVKKSVNSSTSHKDKDGFNFCNLQKYISLALKAEQK